MTGRSTARIEGLSLDKRLLLERQLLKRRAAGARGSIPRRDPNAPCPLSFPQQRLWFLDQWAPGAPTYNAALAMRVTGPLDVALLRDALNAVIGRHEALRTTFVLDGREPVQRVLPTWTSDVPVLELGPVDEVALAHVLRDEARRPFDLAQDLMLRAVAFKLSSDEHVLLFTEHHIAFDGWSDAILFRELEALYGASVDGVAADLPPLTLQYGDYAVWQRRRLEGSLLEDHVAFWREELADVASSHLDLPTDRQRPAVQSFEGAHLYFSIDADVLDGVRALGRKCGATAFMTLLAAFDALLFRYTGQSDIVVGTPIANRNELQLEPLIGFFSNTIVVRTRVAGNPTFVDLIQRVKQSALGAYSHQDLPFEKLVEELQPARDPARNPLFQVNFRVSTESPCLRLPGLAIEPLTVDVGFSRFDLAVEIQLEDTRATGYVEYNHDLFDAATAARIADDYGALLAHVVAQPDDPVLAAPLPSGGDPRIRAATADSGERRIRRRNTRKEE